MSNTIGTIALQQVSQMKDKNIQLTQGGKNWNQYDTLQKIIRYTNNQYNTLSDPNALFYNISNERIPLYAKSIDSNSKDFYVTGVGKTNWFQQWIINSRYRKWAREEGFALTLDENSDNISTFGSSVWKKRKLKSGKVIIEEIDIQNLYFDFSVKNIIDSDLVELHYRTIGQIESQFPGMGKKAAAKAKAARNEEGDTSETHTEKYTVWEWSGWFEGKYMHTIGTGSGRSEVILFTETLKINKDTNQPEDFLYYDIHGERVKNRWLGMGVVERLFDIQKQVNKLVNQNDAANDLASLILFKTADPNTSGNILEQVKSGALISTEDMQEMGITNRFLQGFIAQLQQLEKKADKLCFIQESISGERPPSGVPFRGLALASRGAVSTFDYIKTHIVEKMGQILIKEIFPPLVKSFNKEDLLEIAEDENDVQLYETLLVNHTINNFKISKAKAGLRVFDEDLQALEEKTRQAMETNKKIVNIGKNFFDFEYGIIMNPSNDSIDKAVMNAAIDSAIETMISAPAAVNTPIYQQKLANNNIPPFRLTIEKQADLATTSPGIPTPQAPQDNLSALAAV